MASVPPLAVTSAAVEPPRHALIWPSSLAKTKLAGASVELAVVATWKFPEMPAKTAPVGPPSTVTTSGTIAPVDVYSVLVGAVVGHPPWAGRAPREPPTVDEIRIR